MKCRYCGNETGGARSCPSCGKASYPEPAVQTDPTVPPGTYSGGPLSGPPAEVRNSTLAVVSLVLGIASWFLIPIIGGIAAIITGHMARKEIRESGGRRIGDGLALGGLVTGYANVLLATCGLIFFGGVILSIFGLAASAGN